MNDLKLLMRLCRLSLESAEQTEMGAGMPEDQKNEKTTEPNYSGTPENSVPFIPNDDSANSVALFSRSRINTASMGTFVTTPNAFPLNVVGTVRYVDFGFTSAREYWVEVAEPAYQRFVSDETRGNAIMACLALWPLLDWLWHEHHPGEDTRKNNKDYDLFRQQLFRGCSELEWLRDVAEAGKHRGLGRSNVKVLEAAKTWPSNTQPLKIILDDGGEHDIADVLRRVVEYFRKEHFPI
jgi:hypothetical protein